MPKAEVSLEPAVKAMPRPKSMPQAEVSLEPAVKKMPRPSLSPLGKPPGKNKKDIEESGDALEASNSKYFFCFL